MKTTRTFLLFGCFCLLASALAVGQKTDVDRAARLRGSITPEREWWDVLHYELDIEFFPESKSIAGSNRIRFKTLKSGGRMQIDLQTPLNITAVRHFGKELHFERQGNVYWIDFPEPLEPGTESNVQIDYSGEPQVSPNPPWSGGVSWLEDEHGDPFIATTCQGIGASIWWPNKDHGYDEPDQGMNINVTVPADLTAVSNGRLMKVVDNQPAKTRTFHWSVTQPINNYGVNVNIGNYVNFSDSYEGEFGKLKLDYWVLSHQRQTAEQHFREVPRTIEAFEHWFGKYPFYQDSYKLVVVPYPGMEHQSSVTYGNGFKNGYVGRDLSDTGVGFKFDFIIVHESGHEWFGNNVSMRDAADMWIHEGFTNYAENLFVEYHFTLKEAQDYVIGCRRLIKNDRPIIGQYDLNNEGSGDMYYKAGNMLHTMRQIINDDEQWRTILRGINAKFWHQTVTTQQVETYISEQSGLDFSKFFDQYLRTTDIPTLSYRINGNRVTYRFENVVPGFSVPVEVHINGKSQRIVPAEAKQVLDWETNIESFELDRNYLMNIQDRNEQGQSSRDQSR